MAAARPPPPLIDDLIMEILLHLPPDDIACVARASLVCKTWRGILSDRIFFRRYCYIHGAPPVIGLLYNNYVSGSSLAFIRTTPASPFSQWTSSGSLSGYTILDCRHGRVLLHRSGYKSWLAVWDPVTGLHRSVSTSVRPLKAAVLCASNGCDHLDCSDGPYRVVLLANHGHLAVGTAQTCACHYSSETGKWDVSASIDVHTYPGVMPSLLAGHALFFLIDYRRVLKYDLTSGVLSSIRMPVHYAESRILCTADDGGLGFAAVEGSSLRLVFRRTKPDRIIEWRQDRVIKLDSMISSEIVEHSTKFHVVGFAEGTSYIFIQANDSTFSVELKSGKISKIGCSGSFGPIFPLMRFYIPDLPSTQ